jgi:hypothetical protein
VRSLVWPLRIAVAAFSALLLFELWIVSVKEGHFRLDSIRGAQAGLADFIIRHSFKH